MATYTKTAAQVFVGYSGGSPVEVINSEAVTWGTEVETAIGDLETSVSASQAYSNVDDDNNNVEFGLNIRPDNWVDTGASLIWGQGNTIVGNDIGTVTDAKFQYTTLMGSGVAGEANNLYCCQGFGLRNFYEVTDGIYVAAFGTDNLLHAGTASGITAVGHKNGLYKNNVTDSVMIGTACYGGGDVTTAIVIGGNACDAGQPASYAAADADRHDVSNSIVIGHYGARWLKGAYNVFIGNNAGSGSTNTITGNYNLGIGRATFPTLTSGAGNTVIGDGAGSGIVAGNYNTFIGFSATVPSDYSNCGAFGYGSAAYLTGSNQVQVGSATVTVYTQSAVQTRSDKRDKTDIEPSDLGLEFIMALNPVRYRLDQRERYFDDREAVDATGAPYQERVAVTADGSRASKRISYGLIAQEVGDVVQRLGVDFAGWQDHSLQDGGRDVQSLAYEQFIAPLIKAVQQQQHKIEQLEALLDNVAVRKKG